MPGFREAPSRLLAIPLVLDYKDLQPLEYLLKKLDGHIIEQEFAERIKLTVQLPADQAGLLQQSFPYAY